MIRVAFASSDDEHVDMHFGAAERLVVYDISRGYATLVGAAEFLKVEMHGANRHLGVPEELQKHNLMDLLRRVPLFVKLYRLLFRHRRLFLSTCLAARSEPYAPSRDEVGPPSERPPEDKVVAKLAFLQGCAAVYAASIGASSVKRLMSVNIQPIIVEPGHEIADLLNRVNAALHTGGVAWVAQALARAAPPTQPEPEPKEPASDASKYYQIDPF